MEFKPWPEITRLNKDVIYVTEKIHGTNAQIFIEETVFGNAVIKAGSRTRWLTPEDDNYGFARWVEENSAELIEMLGPGRHYGEWYGLGILGGYGLKEKRFALFDAWKWPAERLRPNRVDVVPVLYKGTLDRMDVPKIMADLKLVGSALVPGYMRPEGVVVNVGRTGVKYKQVFEAEETGWTKGDPNTKRVEAADGVDVSAYLQPIRLAKLLGKDSSLIDNYPQSLPNIVKGYIEDMHKENQYPEDAALAKAAQNQVFKFVKSQFNNLEALLGGY